MRHPAWAVERLIEVLEENSCRLVALYLIAAPAIKQRASRQKDIYTIPGKSAACCSCTAQPNTKPAISAKTVANFYTIRIGLKISLTLLSPLCFVHFDFYHFFTEPLP
jgi:hypothetical protein